MRNHRASFGSSLLAVVLATVCFCAACFFESQYHQAEKSLRHALREARGTASVSGASLPALPDPDKYVRRASWMFYAAVGVCAFAVVMAARHRYWADWVAAVLAGAIALAIPYLVIWVL